MPDILTRYASYVGAIIAAAIISMYAIQKIIFITRYRKLYDVPDDTRKIHGAEIPSLGGIGIFIGYIVIAAFFWPVDCAFQYILCSSVILFFTGIYDDIMNMRPSRKLIAQLLASFITVYFANVRIESLYGLFGIADINDWPGIFVTTLLCTFFINVFNFIDGIDGLAAVLATLYLGMLGILFAWTQYFSFAGISFSLAGATTGLLFFNKAPAKIYMGDTGSMFLGFSIFILSLLFLRDGSYQGLYLIAPLLHSPQSVLMLIIAMLFLPVFDAIRVFVLRIYKGISPLKADRTHLHYYLLDAGFTHSQSVLVILITNVAIILCAYLLQDMNPYINLLSMLLLAAIALLFIYRLRQRNLAPKRY